MITFQFFFCFKENHVFIEEEESPSVIIVEKELDGFDVDGIGNLEDLPKLVFIDEECENLKVVVDDGELTRDIYKKKKSIALQAHTYPFCD